MKRKVAFIMLLSAMLSLASCGSDDVGSMDSFTINEGQISENTGETAENGEAVSSGNIGYVATGTGTEAPVLVETPSDTAVGLPSGDIQEAGVGEEGITPENPVPEMPAESAPSVIDYTPSASAVGTPASTAVLPADAPTPSDYKYGAPPTVYDIQGIKYIDNVLIANKSYSLPSDFNPDLDQTCLNQFNKLQYDASMEGLNIYLSSGFRSYDTQDYIYNDYVARDGQAMADTYSARAGHSEHQSGLAIDVNQIDDSFIGTPEAIWLEAHCWEYGFILRYPQSKQDITGYKYESWHIRYIGTDMSYKIHNKAVEMGDPYLTLEEYFGIDSYYH